MEKYLKKLKAVSLFSGTDDELLRVALASAEIGAFANGEEIPQEHRFGLILKGGAVVTSVDERRKLLLRKFTVGDFFGIADLFSADTPMSRLKAKGSTEVLFLSAPAVSDLLSRDDAFRQRYLCCLSNRIGYLNRKIMFLTAGCAERKLAVYLDTYGETDFTLEESLSALADMLDLGRASLYRAFDRMEEDGCIRRCGNHITVLDREKLSAY